MTLEKFVDHFFDNDYLYRRKLFLAPSKVYFCEILIENSTLAISVDALKYHDKIIGIEDFLKVTKWFMEIVNHLQVNYEAYLFYLNFWVNGSEKKLAYLIINNNIPLLCEVISQTPYSFEIESYSISNSI